MPFVPFIAVHCVTNINFNIDKHQLCFIVFLLTEPRCHKCQGTGHTRAQCPSQNRNVYRCHKCWGTGHFRAQCPTDRRPGERPPTRPTDRRPGERPPTRPTDRRPGERPPTPRPPFPRPSGPQISNDFTTSPPNVVNNFYFNASLDNARFN